MRPHIIRVAEDFWNIRGSFKIGGVVDIGTQASLVRRSSGKFVLLDSYASGGSIEQEVMGLTRGGDDVEAILNVHPFHTVHVRKVHQRFPRARLYGTRRHVERLPKLPWEVERTEDRALHAMFAEDFDFSIPRGVDFISSNENVHFSSVLAFHRRSRTIHVDDTLMYLRLPKAAGRLGRPDLLRFHPTLRQALEKRKGAARDFRRWAEELAERWRDAANLCAAHTAALLEEPHRGATIHDRVLEALGKTRRTLSAHERKFG